MSIALENKDRLSQIWPLIIRHIQWLMSKFGRNPLIVERAVTGLLRLANRNLFRLKDDIADEVLQSLNMLLVRIFTSFRFKYLFQYISFGNAFRWRTSEYNFYFSNCHHLQCSCFLGILHLDCMNYCEQMQQMFTVVITGQFCSGFLKQLAQEHIRINWHL